MGNVILREIVRCSLDQKKEVRELRNLESVRRYMYTDHVISLSEHLAWIDRLDRDEKQVVFAVFVNNKVSGVVSFNAFDRLHRKSDWAFYLGDNVRGGVGAALEYSFLNYAFDTLGLEKLNCEVLQTNQAVVKMHRKFGFRVEGFRRANIIKNDARVGVYLLGMLRAEWLLRRAELGLLYKAVFERFPVSIETRAVAD